jgi:flagellar basal body P-ring formation protein FlgA
MRIVMRKYVLPIAVCLSIANPAHAGDAWVARHNLSPGDILRSDDVEVKSLTQPTPDALPTSRDLVGLEIKRRVYSGHPVGSHDVGSPTTIKVGTPVDVRWESGDLSLILRGSALESGAVGDQIRVLNPTTSRTVRGTILEDGTVEVRNEP